MFQENVFNSFVEFIFLLLIQHLWVFKVNTAMII